MDGDVLMESDRPRVIGFYPTEARAKGIADLVPRWCVARLVGSPGDKWVVLSRSVDPWRPVFAGDETEPTCVDLAADAAEELAARREQ